MEKFHVIRAQYGGIGDELQGRMPLAYAHIVQVLVDAILWMFPIQAFSTGMSPLLVIAGTGLLTISYQGLFDLAKQFLDPYDNENYGKGEDPLSVDTLIAETNAGSVRWLLGFEEMPFNVQRLKDGELYDYLLPVRGYSVEELAQMEEEKIQRDAEMEEQRQREEEERIQREEEEKVERLEEEEEAIQPKEEEEDIQLNETQIQAESNATASKLGNDCVAEIQDIEVNQTAVIAGSAEAQNDTVKDRRPVHKVTTLAGGKAVSFKPDEEKKKVDTIKPAAPRAVANGYLDSLSRPSNVENQNRTVREGGDSFVPDMVDLVEELEQDAATTELKYQEKAAEIEEAAESELLETVDVLIASPGSQDNEKTYLVKEQKKKKEPNDDQTRLDGISQVVGSPSEDPTAMEEVQQPERLEDKAFNSIQELGDGSTEPARESEDDNFVGLQSLSGISELRGSPLDGMTEGGEASLPRSKAESGDDSDDQETSDFMPGQNEKGPDGKEYRLKKYRLSQMLPDEEWKEELEPVQIEPMTLGDYNEQVSKIISAAKEDMLETEAILNAKPGFDPLGWDYDDEQLAPMTEEDLDDPTTNTTDLGVNGDLGEVGEDIDLEALEMDVDDEIETDVDTPADSNSYLDTNGDTSQSPQTDIQKKFDINDSKEGGNNPDDLGGKAATSAEEDLMLTLKIIMDHQGQL
jgi:hypothetical protein